MTTTVIMNVVRYAQLHKIDAKQFVCITSLCNSLMRPGYPRFTWKDVCVRVCACPMPMHPPAYVLKLDSIVCLCVWLVGI